MQILYKGLKGTFKICLLHHVNCVFWLKIKFQETFPWYVCTKYGSFSGCYGKKICLLCFLTQQTFHSTVLTLNMVIGYKFQLDVSHKKLWSRVFPGFCYVRYAAQLLFFLVGNFLPALYSLVIQTTTRMEVTVVHLWPPTALHIHVWCSFPAKSKSDE